MITNSTAIAAAYTRGDKSFLARSSLHKMSDRWLCHQPQGEENVIMISD